MDELSIASAAVEQPHEIVLTDHQLIEKALRENFTTPLSSALSRDA